MPATLNEVMAAVHREIELNGPAGLSPMEVNSKEILWQSIRKQVAGMSENIFGFTDAEHKNEFREELVILAAMVVEAIIQQGIPEMEHRYVPDHTERPRAAWEKAWRSSRVKSLPSTNTKSSP